MKAEDRLKELAKSDAWVSILKPYLGQRIEALRDELERPGGSTDTTRGQIAELRDLIRKIAPEGPLVDSAPYFPPANRPT